LPNITLIEEPQAAFYAWLEQMGEGFRKQVKPGDVVLVVDVGGGTTDFSLIAVTSKDGDVALTRVAVGDHILLGGDNMDLALAHVAESRLSTGERFDAQELSKWVLVCREAKERLLANDGMTEARVAVAGSGSKLVGHSRSVTLLRDEVVSLLVDGFFPLVDPGTLPVQKRSGLLGLGLPYENDPAISSHVSAFLARHLAPGDRVDAVVTAMGAVLETLEIAFHATLAVEAHGVDRLPGRKHDLMNGMIVGSLLSHEVTSL